MQRKLTVFIAVGALLGGLWFGWLGSFGHNLVGGALLGVVAGGLVGWFSGEAARADK